MMKATGPTRAFRASPPFRLEAQSRTECNSCVLTMDLLRVDPYGLPRCLEGIQGRPLWKRTSRVVIFLREASWSHWARPVLLRSARAQAAMLQRKLILQLQPRPTPLPKLRPCIALRRAHGDKCFTSVVVATAEDGTILAASVDDYQFMPADSAGITPVPTPTLDLRTGTPRARCSCRRR